MENKTKSLSKILLISFALVFVIIFLALKVNNRRISRIVASDICSKIGSSDDKNYCMATVNQDSSFCDEVSGKNEKNNCLAMANRDFSFCDNIKDRAFEKACFQNLSLLTKDPSYCDSSEDKDNCYFHYIADSYLGSNTDDIKTKYCNKINDKVIQETCFALQANDKNLCRNNLLCLTLLRKDTSICKGIKGEGKLNCLANKAITSGDISSCDKINNSKWKDLCYSNYATHVSSDISDCNHIVNNGIKNSCYLGSAVRISK